MRIQQLESLIGQQQNQMSGISEFLKALAQDQEVMAEPGAGGNGEVHQMAQTTKM